MSILERFSEQRRHFFAKIRRVLVGANLATVLFASLMLFLPFFLVYLAFSENILRIKSFKREYAVAGDLDRDGEAVEALLAYRSFVVKLGKATKWEIYLTRSDGRKRLATERISFLQNHILNGGIQAIETTRQENISKAEVQCYELEKNKNSLLDGEFAKKANFYLDKNFPAIISEACKIRENSFHDLNLQERFFEAMQSYLTYALEHQTSYYYPAQWVMTQIEKIITSFADAYGTSHSGFEIYENAKRIKAISAKFKSHPALTTSLNLFNRFAQELESQAQMKIIQEVIIVDPDF